MDRRALAGIKTQVILPEPLSVAVQEIADGEYMTLSAAIRLLVVEALRARGKQV